MRTDRTRWAARTLLRVGACGGLLIATCTASCDRKARTEAASTSTQAPSAAPTPSVAKAHRAKPPAARSQPLVACKAAAQPGLASLATIERAKDVFLQVDGDRLYALAYHHALARTTLTRVRRDGADAEQIGRYPGLGPVASFTVSGEHAYFWRKWTIFRVDLRTQALTTAAEGVERPFQVTSRGIFALRCGDADHPDELVRLDPADGEHTIAVMPAREAGKRCSYHYLSVGQTHGFVSDWATHRIYRIVLGTGAVDILVAGQAYPLRSVIEPGHLVFHDAEGLFRIRIDGGWPEPLSEIGKVPYSTLVADANDYWVYSNVRNTNVTGLFRIPRAGGEAHGVATFEPFSKNDPLHETGFIDLAVDDQCLYFARYAHAGTPTSVVTLLAEQKPPSARAEAPRDPTDGL